MNIKSVAPTNKPGPLSFPIDPVQQRNTVGFPQQDLGMNRRDEIPIQAVAQAKFQQRAEQGFGVDIIV